MLPGTEEIGNILEKRYSNIAYLRTGIKGKGGQLKEAALTCKGELFAFVDIDFPMKFEEILEILNCIIENRGDIIIGTRNIGNKEIDRPLIRKIISKVYNKITRFLLNMPISDTQCGVKAWNSKVKESWSKVQDKKWFFDTELLFFSTKHGHKIIEVPVSYRDRRKESKITPLTDSIYFINNLLKLRFGRL